MQVPMLDDNGNEFRDNNGEVAMTEIHDLSDNDLEQYYSTYAGSFMAESTIQELEAEIEARGL